MINSKKPLEKLLQRYRFNKVNKFLFGDVLDFGGNEGELKPFVKGDYTIVNYDHSPIYNKTFDTIVLLAVIEHLEIKEVLLIFKKLKDCLREDGTIFLTTPTLASKPILEFLAFFHILDKKNIEEHRHYWNKIELFRLAEDTNYKIIKYKKFQFGFNQYLVLRHRIN
jgi:2-polyprenyl-3-methyl-5-hydroxy-6-metoxy-1,4-benzoquinol methylase